MMFFKALIAFLILPGLVVGLIPILIVLYAPTHFDGFWWGRLPFAFGIGILFWCIKQFYLEGKGTLAHWSPPKRLVKSGLYQFTRNPMYLGVMLALVGESLISGSLWLLAWALFLMILFSSHVRRIEEPWLAQTFGDEWLEYMISAPRWLPLRRK